MKLSSQFIGKATELAVTKSLIENNCVPSVPIVEARYDLVVEVNNKLVKIQVKTATIAADESAISIRLYSSNTNTKRTVDKNYLEDGIDYFATHYKGTSYLIPIEECGVREKKLRLKPTLNGQIKGISFAKDYELSKIIALI